jgi:hypothetical protein
MELTEERRNLKIDQKILCILKNKGKKKDEQSFRDVANIKCTSVALHMNIENDSII